MAQLLRAYAQLGVHHEQLLPCFLPIAKAQIDLAYPHTQVDLVWSAARLGAKDAEFYETAAACLAACMDRINVT